MDSGAKNMLLDTRQTNFDPVLLAELGKLQSRFIRGEDVVLPLCRILAENSESLAVVLVELEHVNDEEMPASSSCWCRDPVRYLTLWKDIKDWPFASDPPLVHCWHKFIIWPIKHTNLLFFFHSPREGWLNFMMSFGDLLADILMGILSAQCSASHASLMSVDAEHWDSKMFSSIVSNSEDFILVVKQFHDGRSQIVYNNSAATSISLYPRSQLTSMSLQQLFPKAIQANGVELDLSDMLSKSVDFEGEVFCKMANGDQAFLHMHVVALEQDATGGLFALIGRDYTEFRAMEHAMARTQKMQAIGQLVGGIAHDFNNILGVLRGNIELIQIKCNDERLEGYLATLLKSCQRGTELTRRLLQFSRQEQFNAQRCQVNEVIQSLSELFAKSLTSQIHLELKLASHTQDITVDRGDLEDALLNLVINARDAMEGGGNLTIATGEQELGGFLPGLGVKVMVDSGRYVWVSVIDSGHGIPLHLLDKIFEPFFTTKDKSKGTGLGLAMIYGFVKRSRGYMNVISTSSCGTEIRMWFPAMGNKDIEPSYHLSRDDTLPQVCGRLKVLLVDDEPELLRVLSDYCSLMGMEVEVFPDAVAVRARYLNAPCDAGLLVTDVLMPGGINGYELASELVALHPMPVLLVSGFIEDIGLEKHEEMPFKVLHKPFELSAFASALAEVGVKFIAKGEPS